MGGAHHTADQIQENKIPAEAHFSSNLTFPKGLHTTTHLSQEMIVRDQRAAIPVWSGTHREGRLFHSQSGNIWPEIVHFKTVFHQREKKIRPLTTDWDSVALKDAHWVPQNEVTKKLVAYTDGAGKNCLSKISNSKIDQDPVQWVTKFLELCCGHQDEAVGEDRCDDDKKHPNCCNIVNPSRSNVVVGAFKGIWK